MPQTHFQRLHEKTLRWHFSHRIQVEAEFLKEYLVLCVFMRILIFYSSFTLIILSVLDLEFSLDFDSLFYCFMFKKPFVVIE